MIRHDRNNEARLNDLLALIYASIKRITRMEAAAAPLNGYGVNGYGANGELDGERSRLLRRAGQVLAALNALGGSPRHRPAG